MKNVILIITLLLFVGCNEHTSTSKESENTFKVVGIKDGDTIVLLKGEESEVIRLADIDCPEKSQPFGKRAKQFTSDLCFGKSVSLISNYKRDKWKRIIGTIMIADSICLNRELVKAGLAWHFKKYSKDESYAELENTARANKVGLWADAEPIAPWDYRKK